MKDFVRRANLLIRLAPHGPGFVITCLRYLQARRRGIPVIIFFIPFFGQYPYLARVIAKVKENNAGLILFSVDLFHPTNIKARLQEQGFPSAAIFHHFLAPLLGRCDLFISATQWVDYRPRHIRHSVCLFHGLPTKGNTFIPERIERFTDLFFIGPSHRALFQKTYLKDHPDTRIKVHEVGYPKLDDMIAGKIDIGSIRSKWRIPDRRPVVLYAPAYDPGTSLREYGVAVVEKLLELPATLLVKLHPALYSPASDQFNTGGVYWPARMERFSDRDNFRHITDQDITPCLAAADVMVTDVSGAALEFMMLGKPVVFIDSPKFFDEHLPKTYGIDGQTARTDICMNAGRHLGIVVKDLEEMNAAVNHILQGDKNIRKVAPEELIYNPGHATETAWAILKGFLPKNERTTMIERDKA